MIRYVFRNRYMALLWSALICWQAVEFVGTQEDASKQPADLYAECLNKLGLSDGSTEARTRCECLKYVDAANPTAVNATAGQCD